MVDYLAQVIYAKNCPTTFYCIFQLVWVPMTTTQNIMSRVSNIESDNSQNVGLEDYNNISDGIFPYFTKMINR